MIASFSADPSDLSDAIAYELDAIEYLPPLSTSARGANRRMELVLGDQTPDGEQRRITQVQATSSISKAPFVRPWIVYAPLVSVLPLSCRTWSSSGSFGRTVLPIGHSPRSSPPTKNLPGWFFSRTPYVFRETPPRPSISGTYRFLVPFRGTVVHPGGLMLNPMEPLRSLRHDPPRSASRRMS